MEHCGFHSRDACVATDHSTVSVMVDSTDAAQQSMEKCGIHQLQNDTVGKKIDPRYKSIKSRLDVTCID